MWFGLSEHFVQSITPTPGQVINHVCVLQIVVIEYLKTISAHLNVCESVMKATKLTLVSPVDKVALPRTQKGVRHQRLEVYFSPDPELSGGRGLTSDWKPAQHSRSL